METENVDFETIYKKLCADLSKQGQVKDLTKEFNSMTADESRVRFLLCLDVIRAPSFELRSHLKCAKVSSSLRAEGNAEYSRRGREAAALELYTRAVLEAPVSDDPDASLSLALANRSAVLLSMGHLGPCLADMSRALRHGYPERLRPKLEQRLQKVRHQLKNHPRPELAGVLEISGKLDEETEERLVAGAFRPLAASSLTSQNPELPAAEASVLVQDLPKRGRCLVAGRDISPGDVLVVEQPYSSVLLPEEQTSHCHHCCQWCPAPIGCHSCSQVRFCGEQCRRAAWRQYHSIECDIYRPLVALDAGQMALLAVRTVVVAGWERLLVKPEKGAVPDPVYRSDDYQRVRDLIGNVKSRPAGDLFKRSLMAVLLGKLLEVSSLTPSEPNGEADRRERVVRLAAEILRHLQTFPCNAHEVSEQVLPGGQISGAITRQTGAAVLPVLSLTNHSCDPNVFRCYHGTKAVLRALRPVRAGEELQDNYGYHYAVMDRHERRQGLARQYYFLCECSACKGDLPLYASIPSGKPVAVCFNCGEDVRSCGHVADVAPYVAKVQSGASELEQKVGIVLRGESCDVRGQIGRLIAFLERRVKQPWRGLNDAQEAFKMCFLVDGDVCPEAE